VSAALADQPDIAPNDEAILDAYSRAVIGVVEHAG